MTPTTPSQDRSAAPEIWFLTGSQGLYGEETLRQVADQSRGISDLLAAAPGARRPHRVEAGAHRRVGHRGRDARRQRRPAVRRG